MRYTTLFALIATLAIPGTVMAADCQPVFVDSDKSVIIDGIGIEPGGQSTKDFQIRVQNAAGGAGGSPDMSSPGGRGPCQATIRVSRIGALPAPNIPPYSLRASGNRRVEILPDPSASGTANSDVIIANAPSGPQGRAVPFQISVPTEWGLKSGIYTEQLQFSLIDESGGIVDRSTLTTTIVIPSVVSMRLVGAVVGDGSTGPAQVDLGNLSSSNETRSDRFGARIFSTAPYTVRFSSVNLGHLMHDQGRDQIPYRLTFDGNRVDLSGTFEIPYTESTPRGGDRRAMSIVVPPAVALAGRYSDRITMTVTAM